MNKRWKKIKDCGTPPPTGMQKPRRYKAARSVIVLQVQPEGKSVVARTMTADGLELPRHPDQTRVGSRFLHSSGCSALFMQRNQSGTSTNG